MRCCQQLKHALKRLTLNAMATDPEPSKLRPSIDMGVPHRSVVIGTAGHIDHGKTALIHALTGVDTDRLPEEKRRGITVDLGFAALDTAAPDGSALRLSFICLLY